MAREVQLTKADDTVLHTSEPSNQGILIYINAFLPFQPEVKQYKNLNIAFTSSLGLIHGIEFKKCRITAHASCRKWF